MNETIYVVQGFEAVKRGALKAMPAVTFATESQALSRAERLGMRCAGVIAFAQTADVDAGEYSDPVVLLQGPGARAGMRGRSQVEIRASDSVADGGVGVRTEIPAAGVLRLDAGTTPSPAHQ